MPLFAGRAGFTGRHHPFRGAKADHHDQAVQQTIEVPLLPYTLWSMSLSQVVHIPVVAQRQFPMVLRTIEIPQFFDKVIDVPVCRW